MTREVEKKLAVQFEALGHRKVKNIDEPVVVYRVLLNSSKTIPPAAKRLWRQRLGWGAAAIALVIGAGAVTLRESWIPRPGSQPAQPPALMLPKKPSLAVLPFVDLGGGSTQNYFADGMTDDLITDLAKLSGIFVISRNSSWTYKGKSVKVQQVAEELGVRYVLEGSVRREGDTVRINAQLVDAIGGQHLWAERYDGSTRDVFALQDKVIVQIVDALEVKLTREEQARIEQQETQNPQAYEALLEGWDHYRRDSC